MKLNPEKTKLNIFSRSPNEKLANPPLFPYSVQLFYFPCAKFLGITFVNMFTFKNHFDDILERSQQKYHLIGMLLDQKWGPSLQTTSQIYKQCVLRPIFQYGVISTITVSNDVIAKFAKIAEISHQASTSST